MNIEVTKSTFNKIFDNNNSSTGSIQYGELANKFPYTNSELKQSGMIVHNFIEGTNQYYLTDINA